MSDLPFLDLKDPEFSTRGPEVIAARQEHWCARTPFGLAILRHKQAGQLLRDRRLRQGSHAWPEKNGLTGSFADFWSRSIISKEGPSHQALRRILVPALSEELVTGMVPAFEHSAAQLAAKLSGSDCEFMSDFSVPFAGHAIAALLNRPSSDWGFISSNASDLGLAMGINCKSYEPQFNAACSRLMEFSKELIERARVNPSEQDFISRLVSRFDADGSLPHIALLDMIVIAIFGGVDTTRGQLAFLMALFANAPAQWQAIRQDPTLIPNAIEEAIRLHPTTTWASREALETFEFDGLQIAKGTTLHVFVHASATDPMIRENTAFDVTRQRKIHFGFGGGAHHCVGHFMARTDMAAALRVLSSRFASIEFSGKAEWHPDSGNTSPISLPLRFIPV